MLWLRQGIGWCRGALAFSVYIAYTLLWSPCIVVVGFCKWCLPWQRSRRFFTEVLTTIARLWLGGLLAFNRFAYRTRYEIVMPAGLSLTQWYLVISNHQSWLDIFMLQKVFYRKIPMPRFFIKKQLAWIPVLNLAWWALDFPFMKRYSKKALQKNPQLRAKDFETTQKACAKFKHVPVTIMNFVEGTRLTVAKKTLQQSPYQHLLLPRAGGIAYVIAAMQDQLQGILNATIVYPAGVKTFWDFLCGRVPLVKIHVECLPLKAELIGDYFNDVAFRDTFQRWLNQLWQEKDALIVQLSTTRT